MGKLVVIIGGNIGDRLMYIRKASQLLENRIGKLTAVSSIYETAAWGGNSEGDYLNQVLLIESEESASVILERIWQIEAQCDRKRDTKWGDRTMDIDILYFGNEVIDTPNLQIPHPEIANRKFVLEPLSEIIPDFIHPVLKKTQTELLLVCKDQSWVKKYKSPE